MIIQGEFDQIKAWAFHGNGKKKFPFDYNARPLGESEVEVEISHCGVCDSDLHVMDSACGPCQYPVVTGHEIVGITTATGPSATNLKISDKFGAQAGACLKYVCKIFPKDVDNLCSKRALAYNDRWLDNQKNYGRYD